MNSQTLHSMLTTLTHEAAFTRTQAEKLISAIEVSQTKLATRKDITDLRKALKLRLTMLELRMVLQLYSAMGLLFVALQLFG